MTFWALFKQSIVVTAVIALVLIVTLCILIATGKDVPEQYWALVSLVVGYFVGQKAGQSAPVTSKK